MTELLLLYALLKMSSHILDVPWCLSTLKTDRCSKESNAFS